MKVVRFYAPGDLRYEDADEPTPGPDEVKIKVWATSTCGTDVKIFGAGHQNLDPPRVIGHEIAGEVVEVGSAVDGWESGDRVQVIAAIPCGTCDECLHGRMSVCPNQVSMGYQFDGGFAEYMIVPHEVLRVDGLNRLPDGLSYVAASVAEPFACAINAQTLARVGEGDDVVIVGSGPIGCLHVRLARANGARRITLVELNLDRLQQAADIVKPDETICAGEVDVVDAVMDLTHGRGVDVTITATSAGIAQEQAVRYAARQGRISFFGGLPKDKPMISLDSNLVHYRELTIVGANGSSPANNKDALNRIATGAVPVLDLVTHRLPLIEVPRAIEIVRSGEGIKVTIEPQS